MNVCNKISYSSAKEARLDIKVINSRGCKNNNIKLRPYLCHNCNNWHTTSLGKKDSKKIGEQKREITRRLGIVKRLSIQNTIDTVLKLQESWMTLILNDGDHRVECIILNEKRIISLNN